MHKHLRGGVGAVAALAIFAISSPVTVHAEPARVVVSATSSATTAAVRNANGSFTVSWSGAGRHQVYASTRPGNPSKNGRLVGASAFGTLNVKGLEDDARWYFEVVSPTARALAKQATKAKRTKLILKGKKRKAKQVKPVDPKGVVTSTRGVGLESSTNTRDMGGLRTVDGRSVKWGVLFRSDAITDPTSRDESLLRSMRLRHAVDFRSEGEIESAGPNKLGGGVHVHLVPLLDASTDALSLAIQTALRSGDPSLVDDLLGDGKAEEIAATGPTLMMQSEAARAGFAEALKVIAQSDGVPFIFNCTAGKDRTGVFAAVLQRLLGVPEQAILADYELSNAYRAASNQGTYDYLASRGVNVDLLRPLMEQSGENLAAMFRSIEADFGSFDRFLTKGLGLDRATIKTLQKKLLV